MNDNLLISQYKLKSTGNILKIYQDDSPESPREWNNLGIMICAHKRYTLGDKQAENLSRYDSWKEWCKHEVEVGSCGLLLPLFMMDHSGLTIQTKPFGGDYGYFDSGQIGYIYVTKEQLRKEYSVKRITTTILEKAKRVLLGEVETYNQYLNGDIYSFILESPDGNIEDSCSGFYGSDYKTNGMLNYINELDGFKEL